MEDAVDVSEIHSLGPFEDVLRHQPKARVIGELLDIPRRAAGPDQVVHARHVMPTSEQRFAQVGADEAGSPRDDRMRCA